MGDTRRNSDIAGRWRADAVTVEPPALVVLITPVVLTVTVEGFDELQSQRNLGDCVSLSVQHGWRRDRLTGSRKYAMGNCWYLRVTASVEIDWTAQVLKTQRLAGHIAGAGEYRRHSRGVGRYLRLPIRSPVTGVVAVAAETVATSDGITCQAKGPTLAVMSRPRLRAVA